MNQPDFLAVFLQIISKFSISHSFDVDNI